MVEAVGEKMSSSSWQILLILVQTNRRTLGAGDQRSLQLGEDGWTIRRGGGPRMEVVWRWRDGTSLLGFDRGP